MCSVTAYNERLSSEVTALRIECEAREAEIAQLKNLLVLSTTKLDVCSCCQGVTLNKGLNTFPEKAWQQLCDNTLSIDNSDTVIRALEEQLNTKSKQLDSCVQEISELKKKICSSGFQNGSAFDENTAHLLCQINFLHGEVERLEEQMLRLRAENAKKEFSSFSVTYSEDLCGKDKNFHTATEHVRSKKSISKAEGEVALRCKVLENQLALALSEKNSLLIQKNEHCTRIRKLEAKLKERKTEVSEAQKMAFDVSAASGSQIKSLQEVIQVLSDERSLLKKELISLRGELNIEKANCEAQTERSLLLASTQTEIVPLFEKECQVNSVTFVSESGSQSVQSLTHMLELKCTECDDLRARIDDLLSVHRETLSTLEMTKKRFDEEVEKKTIFADDVEKLSLQLRSLQQRCSQQAAAERELQGKISIIDEQKQKLRLNCATLEREKNCLEERIQQYQKDMEQLVANKNYCNQQVGQLTSENENLQANLRQLHQQEAQLAYSLKAKDVELREIFSAYQNAAKELESYMEAQRSLERELEVTRATLASKEQGVIYLQEQLNQLHHRDQQLSLDLQTFEYENSQLHRKLVQSEALGTQLEAKCDDLQQVLLAKDRATEELQQCLAELSKQIALRDNECLLLRHQSESLQRDLSRLQSAHESDLDRLRELEDANARLVVRGMISGDKDNGLNFFRSKDGLAKESIDEKTFAVQTLQDELRKEKEEKAKYIVELETAQASLKEALQSKERLQQVVLNQAATLSRLSR